MKPVRHFLKLSELSRAELMSIIQRASALRETHQPAYRPFLGRTLAMIFTKSSTRTRVSFEAGLAKFGGHALFLHSAATQLGRDEPIADTARVLSRMCDAIMLRNDSQADQSEMAEHSRVPVINGLSDQHHPCQLLADLQTWGEQRGELTGRTAAWIGDGNNVCHSWIEAAGILNFQLRVSSPPGYGPRADTLAASQGQARAVEDPAEAVSGADLVVTDTWTSMGRETEQARRIDVFQRWQVDASLMARAHPDALFMHCLPAHRGEEVSAEVIDGPQSVVWDEAENRLWAQMALLEWLWKN